MKILHNDVLFDLTLFFMFCISIDRLGFWSFIICRLKAFFLLMENLSNVAIFEFDIALDKTSRTAACRCHNLACKLV